MTDRFRMLPSYHYEDNTDGNLLKSVGKPLRDYKIEGNCFQDGTPSPDNPIDIQCCGERTVNLIDFADYLNQTLPYTRNWGWGATAIYGNDGTITINCSSVTTSHDANDVYFFDSPYMESGTYTISGVPYGESDSGQRLFNLFGYYYENGVHISKYLNNISVGEGGVTFTIGENQGISFSLRCTRAFTAKNMIFKPQLQKGNTATAYEPYGYKVPVTVSNDKGEKTYNIYLDEPLRKVGDYADYVDFRNGKVVRKCYGQKVKVRDGLFVELNSSAWQREGHTSFYIGWNPMDKTGLQALEQRQICNIFSDSSGSMWNWSACTFPGNYCLCSTNNTRVFYAILENKYLDGITDESTDEEKIVACKAFIQNNNLEVVYCMSEPIEQPITLPQILTEKHTNIISVGTTLQPSKVNYQYYKGGK